MELLFLYEKLLLLFGFGDFFGLKVDILEFKLLWDCRFPFFSKKPIWFLPPSKTGVAISEESDY